MGIVNAHEQLRQGIRQGKFLGGIMDKIIPNEVTSFMNSAADKLMPKELAPYMSIIAPVLTPIIGPAAAHALAQLGSAKMNDGQLDPFAALAVHGAGSTQTARGIRASYDPSLSAFDPSQGGTLGQRLSGAAGDYFGGSGIAGGTAGNTGNMFSRAFQPTQSMFTSTSAANNPLFDGIDLGEHFKFMERESDILKNLNKSQELKFADKYKQFNMADFKKLSNAQQDQLLRKGMDAVPEKASGIVSEKGKKAIDAHNANLKPTDVNYIKTSDQAQKILGDGIFEITPEINAMPSTNNVFDSITDGTMEFFMPELDESQQLLAGISKGSGADISKAFNAMTLEGQIATVSSMTALTQASAIEKAMKDAEYKSKQERDAVYREYFDSYEKYGRRKYNDPRYLRYKDPEMVKIYEEIYGFKDGGRIHKNMGGIMEAAPGVPQGMELDYRNSGGFIPMGGPERADDVPAMLSKNEFVLTADAMRGLDKMNGGSGDPRNAAKHMYQMMEQMEAMA
jgi:hypothetical protein